MTLPGTVVEELTTPPPRSAPTDTGVWFAAHHTEKGPIDEAVLVTSLAQFVTVFGARVSHSPLYDCVESFFRDGGSRLYIGRVVGPDPVLASVTLEDSNSADTLTVNAKSVGTWGNALNVAVTAGDAGGEFKLVISHDTLGTLETSPSLATKAAAIAWAANSDYVDCEDEASLLDPAVVAAQSLAGGTDDYANATDNTWADSLELFTKDLGPGQVSFPGRTTTTAHSQLAAHCEALGGMRFAIYDLADTATKATLKTAVSTMRSSGKGKYGGFFVPWQVIPGITPGTTRTIPFSALQAALYARSDGLGKSPNEPAAGDNGQSKFAIGLSQPAWSDADREDLNDSGVNVARVIYGGVRSYGNRTAVDPILDSNWLECSNRRLYMVVAAKGDVIAEKFVQKQIDGQGNVFAAYAGELTGMLLPYYAQGSLYGETPEEAFNVDVGPQVNTPETIAAKEIHAVISLKMSPSAERVILQISKSQITEAVA